TFHPKEADPRGKKEDDTHDIETCPQRIIRPDNKAFSGPPSFFTLENSDIPSITSQSIFKRDFE
ncbi:44543_t:CDS:2, partial [Gigaspora margarita]